jgi:hypothetical protein
MQMSRAVEKDEVGGFTLLGFLGGRATPLQSPLVLARTGRAKSWKHHIENSLKGDSFQKRRKR